MQIPISPLYKKGVWGIGNTLSAYGKDLFTKEEGLTPSKAFPKLQAPISPLYRKGVWGIGNTILGLWEGPHYKKMRG